MTQNKKLANRATSKKSDFFGNFSSLVWVVSIFQMAEVAMVDKSLLRSGWLVVVGEGKEGGKLVDCCE